MYADISKILLQFGGSSVKLFQDSDFDNFIITGQLMDFPVLDLHGSTSCHVNIAVLYNEKKIYIIKMGYFFSFPRIKHKDP